MLLDRRLRSLARHRRWQRCYDGLTGPAAACLGVAAAAVVVVKLAAPTGQWLVPALVAAGALAPLIALPRHWRRSDPPELLAGHLDQQLGADGVAMALAALPPPLRVGWETRLRDALSDWRPPSLRWSAGRTTCAALACLAVALALPVSPIRPTTLSPVMRLFAPTSERLEALAELGALPPVRAEELRRQLAELAKHAESEGMDQATWDGVDRAGRDLDGLATAAGRRLAEALAVAEAAQESGRADGAAHTPESAEAATAAAERMAQALADLAVQAPGLVPQLPPGANADQLRAALAAAEAKGLISPEQRAALERLGLKPAESRGELDAEAARALADQLAEHLGRSRAALSECPGCEGLDGLFARLLTPFGPPTRGPGHAPLTRGEPVRSPGGGTEALQPGARLNPDGSVTLAEQVRDADIDEAASHAAVRGAGQTFDPAAADARRATTAPRHRAAVGRYFAGGEPAPASAPPPLP